MSYVDLEDTSWLHGDCDQGPAGCDRKVNSLTLEGPGAAAPLWVPIGVPFGVPAHGCQRQRQRRTKPGLARRPAELPTGMEKAVGSPAAGRPASRGRP